MSEDHTETLRTSIRRLAFDEHNVDNWRDLESSLLCWKEPHEGGTVTCEYIDDNLEQFVGNQAQLIRSIFHISKMTPTESTRHSILAAQHVFARVVAAIERAAIVAQIQGANIREPPSPCSTGERSPVVSPVFSLHANSPPPTLSKCK
jgi:hypothetical protein